MSTFCPECKGSGESGQFGVLDCAAPNCTAATERAALDTHLLALGRLHERDLVWEAYKLGQAKAQVFIPPALAEIEEEIHRRADKECCLEDGCDFTVTITSEQYERLCAPLAAPANNNTESKTTPVGD